MESTPKSLRLQIGIFGRTNVGKSSFLNMIANQDVAVTSHIPGTTTDIVEKAMELLPIGPVTFLDTAGIDDLSELSEKRIAKTIKVIDRSDIAILILEPNVWNDYEENIFNELKKKKIPTIFLINKIDTAQLQDNFLSKIKELNKKIILSSSIDKEMREKYIQAIKQAILDILPPSFSNQPPLISDIIKKDDLIVLIIPIDNEAPKGRVILPQVQVLRDALDSNAAAIVVQDTEYPSILDRFKEKVDLVICDSQVVDKMVAGTPENVNCTTFSIVFSRFKGDLIEEVRAVRMLDKITENDKILIAEACSHHPNEDDIGRVKIPRWLKKHLGFDAKIDIYSGRDYPDNLSDYKLIIHCGGCMITRNEKLSRMRRAGEANVPITNYGIIISYMQGVLERVLSPFPDALKAYYEG
ncbi:MAG TPA: [FeFe] hydrogenase H-cluster maturation GTPase HydF [Candidatus Kapabacteria bacterium]|nr:[FeFe] hydrogenase H-cluster maturation GTPase HydF [Candidatus Kapabacteria bacterium]